MKTSAGSNILTKPRQSQSPVKRYLWARRGSGRHDEAITATTLDKIDAIGNHSAVVPALFKHPTEFGEIDGKREGDLNPSTWQIFSRSIIPKNFLHFSTSLFYSEHVQEVPDPDEYQRTKAALDSSGFRIPAGLGDDAGVPVDTRVHVRRNSKIIVHLGIRGT